MNRTNAPRTWHNCYDLSWKGLIVPEAFAHPAKFARGLIDRIVTHGLERGYWRVGDTVGDPFGGVALGGIVCGYHGLNWVGVELESSASDPPGSPFVERGRQNIALHEAKWRALGLSSRVTLLQGDSRRFADLVRPAAIVTSPPYADSVNSQQHGIDWTKCPSVEGRRRGEGTKHEQTFRDQMAYGNTPGQIGALSAGELDAVLTSPPYAQALGNGGNSTRFDFLQEKKSLPANQYGNTPGQIEQLPVGGFAAVVTSPPWEKSLNDGYDRSEPADRYAAWAKNLAGSNRLARSVGQNYGSAQGQIGNDRGETYWQAMRQVYSQCLIALRPGGVMAVVVKDYVKNKQRVPLSDQTLALLVHLGFEPIDRVAAMLVKETRHAGLFNGESIIQTKSRKSFFRRLAEKKGSPAIDHEDVLFVRKDASLPPGTEVDRG